jgi:hypothetical protein
MASKKTGSTKPVKSPKSAKRLVKKAAAKAPAKTDKVKSATKPAATKAKAAAKPAPVRKINSKPVLAKTTGLNISPAKVKNVVSNLVLNRDSWSALSELRQARPRTEKTMVDGKEVATAHKGTPVAQLSAETQAFMAFATSEYERAQRDDYARAKVSGMATDARSAYTAARNTAKALHDKEHSERYLDNSGSSFDYEAFNTKYDKKFYSAYKSAPPAEGSDEWSIAIERVTKLKSRFSTNSRVFLSAFAEYLIRQLAANGTVCCVADKKKIIQLSHVLNTTKDGFAERFPLYPLITNLNTFRQAQAHLQSQKDKATAKADPSDEAKSEDARKSPTTDLFQLDGVSLDKQYQFRYYIAETCRETRMDLASTEKGADGKLMEVYNHTSVSKVFKNFCSTLVCEFLMRIGRMLEKEIETRGIKTVNDTIIGAVISHYHTVCGVDDADTIDFIRNASTKYYSYVADRQQKRKDGLPGTTGDLPYANETSA